jgi:hypothetical protein
LRCRIFLVRKTCKVSLSISAFCRQRRGEERKRRDLLLGEVAGRTCEVTKKVLLGSFEREN